MDEFQELESGPEFDNLVALMEDPEKEIESTIQEFNLLGDHEDPTFIIKDFTAHSNCSKNIDIGFVIDGSGTHF